MTKQEIKEAAEPPLDCRVGRISQARSEGDTARACGLDRALNPHADGEFEFAAWNDGWDYGAPNAKSTGAARKTPQNEYEATSELEQLLREVALFLGDLPRDLGAWQP